MNPILRCLDFPPSVREELRAVIRDDRHFFLSVREEELRDSVFPDYIKC